MNESERDLNCLERLRGRDPAALEELYDRHTPLLYPVILKIVGRAVEAEEVLQDTWLQVWRNPDSFDARRGAVVAWLLVVARSRAIDRVRSLSSRQRMHDRVEAEPPAPAAGPADEAEQLQASARVKTAMAALSPQQRQVLELAYFGGLSQTEIAGRIGAPLGTVKSWTRQGLLKLREQLPEGILT